jgi:hypothetical protein
MYQYKPTPKKRDAKIILAGIALGTILFTCGSWAEAVAEHGADFHLDTPASDWQNQNDAQEESKGGEPTSYIDDNGVQHMYENGNEHC